MYETERAVPRRIAQAILNSLQSGVVPRVGLPYIAVGRKEEIAALRRDTELIAEGGASFRFLIGKYGAGKSFLLQTMRNYVFAQGFVVADADLSPERRLQGSKGQGLATYRELIANLATKTKPEGGALRLILDKWISAAEQAVAAERGGFQEDGAFYALVEQKIAAAVDALQDMVHGFEFAKLLRRYYLAGIEGDDEVKERILKWFRGEYENKREAKEALGINLIISDANWYDHIKLLSQFFHSAGYAGTLLLLDEAANLCKIPNAITRQYNYEVLLTMYNDMMQGKAGYLGIWLGATPEALEDKRRGLFSYEALSSRLMVSRFSRSGSRDLFSPVLRLEALTPEEMLVLCEKLSAMHGALYSDERQFSEEELVFFVQTSYARVGASTQITPREMTRDFIFLLDALHQNPETSMAELLAMEQISGGRECAEADSKLLSMKKGRVFGTEQGTERQSGESDAPFDFSF